MVPRTRVPVGSSAVCSSREPAAGPSTAKTVSRVIRRLSATGAVVRPRLARVATAQLDHGQAVGGPRGADDLLGRHRRREHDALVGVLVVGHEQRPGALAVRHDDVEVVAVVAELLGLRLVVLGVLVELRGAARDRVAPADDRVPAVAARHAHVVDGGGDRTDGVERQPGGAGALPVPVAGARGGEGAPGRLRGEGDGGGPDGRGAQHGATAQGARGHVAEVAGLGGVGHLLEARVPTPQVAGDGAAVRVGATGHGQQPGVGSLGGEGHRGSWWRIDPWRDVRWLVGHCVSDRGPDPTAPVWPDGDDDVNSGRGEVDGKMEPCPPAPTPCSGGVRWC